MTLEKAKELLTLELAAPGTVDPADLSKAQKIGIEAIKWLQFDRRTSHRDFEPLLPGETKEPPYLFAL